MSEPIKPALTSEEWTHREFGIAGAREGDIFFAYVKPETGTIHMGWNGDDLRPIAQLQPLAALALYGQPFGFTREDVKLLREVAETHAAESGEDWHEDVAPIKELADRIEALLPRAV